MCMVQVAGGLEEASVDGKVVVAICRQCHGRLCS